jgi:hypothetical protein
MRIKLNNIEVYSYPFPHFISKANVNLGNHTIKDLLNTVDEDRFRIQKNEDFQKKELRADSGILGDLLRDIQSHEIRNLCQEIFQISELKSDLKFDGGGLTISELNSYLRYHNDFPYSSETKSYRVVNTLLYLGGHDLEGGDLHLLDPISFTVEKIIKLEYGLFVAFPTSKNTPHGFSRVRRGTRISINSYLYRDKPLDDRFEPTKTEWL